MCLCILHSGALYKRNTSGKFLKVLVQGYYIPQFIFIVQIMGTHRTLIAGESDG